MKCSFYPFFLAQLCATSGVWQSFRYYRMFCNLRTATLPYHLFADLVDFGYLYHQQGKQ